MRSDKAPNPHHVTPCGPDEVYDSGGDPQANSIIDAIDRLTEAVKALAPTTASVLPVPCGRRGPDGWPCVYDRGHDGKCI